MMPDEKCQLLALFKDKANWTRDVEARDRSGTPVHYDDPSAVAWDLAGGLCHLFGWQRASMLFGQVQRHIADVQRRSFGWPAPQTNIEAMRSLQEFNDRTTTDFSILYEQLESMPSWVRGRRRVTRSDDSAPANDCDPLPREER